MGILVDFVDVFATASFFLKFSQPGSLSVDPTFTDKRSISSLEATPGTGVRSNSLFWQLSTPSLPRRMDRLHLAEILTQIFHKGKA